MAILLRALRLLSMTVWVGGLIFFAFILAPLAFSSLPSAQEAGTIVGGTLRVLNLIGLLCGGVFLIATIILWFRSDSYRRKLFPAEFLLVCGMIFCTSVVQRGIMPAMERDRIAAGGDINAAPAGSFERKDFDRLHSMSEKIEGSALLLGVISVILIAAERCPPLRRSPYL